MKILKARVDWNKDYDNRPNLVVLVDKMPTHDEMFFTQVDSIYYSVTGGNANYFHYVSPGEGYAGRVFEINMVDGTKKALKGPWSSRAGCVNSVVSAHNKEFEHIVDVTMTADPNQYSGKTIGCFYASSITLSLAKEAAKKANCYLVRENLNGDITYHPSMVQNFIVKPRNRNKSKPTYKRFVLNRDYEFKTLREAKSEVPTKIISGCTVDPKTGNITSIYDSRSRYSGEVKFMADNGKIFSAEQAAVLAYAFGQIPIVKEKLELVDLRY